MTLSDNRSTAAVLSRVLRRKHGINIHGDRTREGSRVRARDPYPVVLTDVVDVETRAKHAEAITAALLREERAFELNAARDGFVRWQRIRSVDQHPERDDAATRAIAGMVGQLVASGMEFRANCDTYGFAIVGPITPIRHVPAESRLGG